MAKMTEQIPAEIAKGRLQAQSLLNACRLSLQSSIPKYWTYMGLLRSISKAFISYHDNMQIAPTEFAIKDSFVACRTTKRPPRNLTNFLRSSDDCDYESPPCLWFRLVPRQRLANKTRQQNMFKLGRFRGAIPPKTDESLGFLPSALSKSFSVTKPCWEGQDAIGSGSKRIVGFERY